jgi:hypothetical protein
MVKSRNLFTSTMHITYAHEVFHPVLMASGPLHRRSTPDPDADAGSLSVRTSGGFSVPATACACEHSLGLIVPPLRMSVTRGTPSTVSAPVPRVTSSCSAHHPRPARRALASMSRPVRVATLLSALFRETTVFRAALMPFLPDPAAACLRGSAVARPAVRQFPPLRRRVVDANGTFRRLRASYYRERLVQL